MKLLTVLLLLISISLSMNCFAFPFDYIVTGSGDGKEVTGYLTENENGTIRGSVDSSYVECSWVGYGTLECQSVQNFYEMEVTE